MAIAINFNNYLAVYTIEIYNVIANYLLTIEVVSFEFTFVHMLPE